jgi:hypothetical protein
MIRSVISIHSSQKIWLIVLMMGLPAFIGGGYIHYHDNANARLGVRIDRRAAIEQAINHAQRLGYPVAEWPAYVRFERDNDLYYYHLHRGQVASPPNHEYVPAATIGVRFHAPDRDQMVEVILDVEGRPIGYQQILSRHLQVAGSTESESKRVVWEALKQRLTEKIGKADLVIPAVTELPAGEAVRGEPSTRVYRWRWPLADSPELSLVSVIKVRADRVVGDRLEATLDKQYVMTRLGRGTTAGRISTVGYYLLMTMVILFGIFRFIQRVRQKEVSYSRSFMLALVVAVVMSLPLWLTDVGTYDRLFRPDNPISEWVVLVGSSFVFIIVGLLLGLAYASGEGDLREPYPGKLASLDVLLTGRMVARNVARAVLIGTALGGWFFLGTSLLRRVWRRDLPTTEIGELDAWFGHLPWLNSFTFWMPEVILIVVIGVLIPLPFLYRRLRSHRRVLPVLLVTVWIASTTPDQASHSLSLIAVLGLLRMAVTVVAFLEFDLLTAIVALGAPLFAGEALSLLAQPSTSLHQAGQYSLLIGLVIFGIALVMSYRGTSYREEDVRPLYATNLAERLAMQAEMNAAREVQIQLLPDKIPTLAGFEIAAECLPANEVGGDYYDLNVLDRHQLSILVAEGGGNGLGSALSIAFARGYLLPMVTGTLGDNHSPLELMRALCDRLLGDFGAESRIGFILALVDREEGVVRYARSGDYPRIRVYDGQSLLIPPEMNRTFQSTSRPAEHFLLTEGRVGIQPGQTLLITTNGLERNLTEPGRLDKFLVPLLGPEWRGNQPALQRRLTESVRHLSKLSRRVGNTDDLTAVLVRIEEV